MKYHKAYFKTNKFKAVLYATMWTLLLFIIIWEGGHSNISETLYSTLLFFVNYLLFVPIFLLNQRIYRFLLFNALYIALTLLIFQYFDAISLNIRFVLINLAPFALSIAIRVTQDWFKVRNEKIEIERLYLESELAMLKYQIQPHFFFNSLNNIYSLIDIEPEKAKETVHGLAKLMRYLLYETSIGKIGLDKEIDFINNLIQLMKLRVNNDIVKIDYKFPQNVSNIKVAPLLFATLIENAFKHGVSAGKPSEISINMRVDNGMVIFFVQNSFFPKDKTDKSGSGIGMENLRQRLDKLYKNKYTLTQSKVNNYFSTTLSINI